MAPGAQLRRRWQMQKRNQAGLVKGKPRSLSRGQLKTTQTKVLSNLMSQMLWLQALWLQAPQLALEILHVTRQK